MRRSINRSQHPQQGLFNTLAATLAHRLERDEPSFRPPVGRDAHPKHHGCVRGRFLVEADLPAPLRRGVCKIGPRHFEVWIRFSNAFRRRHDLTWDARGMAIKLLDVGGSSLLAEPHHDRGPQATQDFLLVSHPVFFARTAADFVDFPAAAAGAGSFTSLLSGLLPYFLGLNPSKWRLRGLLAMFGSFKWIEDPLGIAYFSQVPYRFGEHRAKYCVRPQQPAKNLRSRRFLLLVAAYVTLSMLSLGRARFSRWEHMLRRSLVAHLREREARFDFMVQLGTDAMPVDDAVVAWDERVSPYVKVATIVVDRLPERFDADEMMAFGEHLSFTPWHGITDHEPLGSINAARRHVYERISALRHTLNKRQQREPRAGETPGDYLRSIEEDTE